MSATTDVNLESVIAKAQIAQREWAANPLARSTALSKAAEIFKAHQAELVESMVKEVHKPLTEARGECGRAIAILEFFSATVLDPDGDTYPGVNSTLLYSQRRPHGVAGLITPWNFPVAIPLWKAAPALAAGNAVVIKPSEFSTQTALLVSELLNKVLPPDIFTVVPGGAEIGRELIERSDVISFTGSVKVGRTVVAEAARLGKPVQAEMGGLNPAIVLPDADLSLLAAQFPIAAFSYSGQKCTATRRVIIVGDQARRDEVTKVLTEVTQKLVVGDASSETTFVGPLIHSASFENYANAVTSAAQVGEILAGGVVNRNGKNLPTPTLTRGVPMTHQLMCEEVFGPIAHIVYASDANEAIAIANGVEYGLTASIHTQDLASAITLSSQLKTGMVKVNGPTAGVDFYAPFGGTKSSSYGMREQGKVAMDFYTRLQTVTITPGKGRF